MTILPLNHSAYDETAHRERAYYRYLNRVQGDHFGDHISDWLEGFPCLYGKPLHLTLLCSQCEASYPFHLDAGIAAADICHASENEAKRERAYYRYLQRIENGLEGDHITDWLEGQAMDVARQRAYLETTCEACGAEESPEIDVTVVTGRTATGQTFGFVTAEPVYRDLAALAADEYPKEAVIADPELGILYKKAPKKKDDLTAIAGIDADTAKVLNKLGIYQYRQFSTLTPERLAALNERSALPFTWDEMGKRLAAVGTFGQPIHFGADTFEGLIGDSPVQRENLVYFDESQFGDGQAASDAPCDEGAPCGTNNFPIDYEMILERRFESDDVNVSDNLGILYTSRPKVVDDFTLLTSVDDAEADLLQQQGFYKFKQLEYLTPIQFEELKKSTDIQCSWSEWSQQLDATEHFVPANEWDLRDQLGAYEGQNISIDPDLGIVFNDAPEHVDQLADHPSVNEYEAEELHSLGIYQIRQLEQLSPRAIRFLENQIGVSLANSGPVAEVEAPQGEEVVVDEVLGQIYEEAPDTVDKLTRIKGVGPVLEKKLHEFGVYRFWQIARWNDEHVSAFNDRLSFKGRIQRENWIAQAKDFA